MMATKKKAALGRGLAALLPEKNSGRPAAAQKVPLASLKPNEHQPRTDFNQEKIEGLARSIRASGILQPIVVTPRGRGYMIIAGERRFRAAKLAGIQEVPVVIHAVDGDRDLVELALVENLQRADLNPIEEAEAFEKLRGGFGLTQEEIATRVGRNRSTVANTVRLLRLPEELQGHLRSGALSFGHGKAILGLEKVEDQLRLGREVVDQGMSVRQTEQWVSSRPDATDGRMKAKKNEPEKDVHARDAEEKLIRALRVPVDIVRRGRRGQIRLGFSSEPELMRLFDCLMQAARLDRGAS